MNKYKNFLDDDGTYGLMKPINLKEIIKQAKQEKAKEIFRDLERWFKKTNSCVHTLKKYKQLKKKHLEG